MTIEVKLMEEAGVKSALCAKLLAELPMWFGRPKANSRYIRGMADRDAYAGFVDGAACGLIALEYHFGVTCNVWWLGVNPLVHRRGLGRALIDQAITEARSRGCRQLAVETMSPRAQSPEYDLTRLFYEAMGFAPFIEFEPEPGDYMMWMIRAI